MTKRRLEKVSLSELQSIKQSLNCFVQFSPELLPGMPLSFTAGRTILLLKHDSQGRSVCDTKGEYCNLDHKCCKILLLWKQDKSPCAFSSTGLGLTDQQDNAVI